MMCQTGDMVSEQYAYPLKQITPLPDHKAHAVFSDGLEGVDDFSFVLDYPGFEHLRDPKNFAKIHVTPDGFISWGQDFEISWEGTYQRLSGKHWKDAFPPNTWEPITIVDARSVAPLVVYVKFNDGVEGEIDLNGISADTAILKKHSKKGFRKHSPKNKGPTITEWDQMVLDGMEYDTAEMYELLSGKDIDVAEKEFNSLTA